MNGFGNCRTSAVLRSTANTVSLTYLSKLRYQKIPSSSRLQSRVVDSPDNVHRRFFPAARRRAVPRSADNPRRSPCRAGSRPLIPGRLFRCYTETERASSRYIARCARSHLPASGKTRRAYFHSRNALSSYILPHHPSLFSQSSLPQSMRLSAVIRRDSPLEAIRLRCIRVLLAIDLTHEHQ